MKHSEFLDIMVNLERSINALSKALEEELHEDGYKLDANKWMLAHYAVDLAKGMTATKCSIGEMHSQAYAEEKPQKAELLQMKLDSINDDIRRAENCLNDIDIDGAYFWLASAHETIK